jgi:hypothetical protein
MQIEAGFCDTKSRHYGLDLTHQSQIQTERRTNLLRIAALIIFVLWLVMIRLNCQRPF